MASGSFSVRTSNEHVVGTVKWTATKNVSNNTSYVKATMYLSRNNKGYTTWGTGDFFVTIDGTKISANNKDFTITYNSNTVMVSGSKTVSHNSDGTKTITIGWGGDSNVFNVYDDSGSARLDTIPRESSLTSSASWTAGSNRTISIQRYSSSFRHEVEISVKQKDGSWNWVKRVSFSTSETSKSTSFTTDENIEIFSILDGRSSADTRMQLQTFSGNTMIGAKDYFGTVTAPSASTAKITNPTGVSSASGQGDSTVWIDQTINLAISRANSSFTHTVRFKDANNGSVLKEFTNVGTSVSWTPSQSEKNTLYNKIPNSIEFDGQIDVITYYHGVQVRSTTNTDINYRVRNSNPIFNGSITYKDTNSTTTAITGNNQYIIQNKSNLQVTIPLSSKATAVNGATMKNYVVTVNGVSKSANYSSSSDVVLNFGTVNASSNITMTVKAVDSRGLSTSQTKKITVLGYKNPSLEFTLSRLNGFDSQTTLSSKGSFSLLNINGTNKNTIQSLQYRYKPTTSSTWSSWSNLNFTIQYPNFTGTNITLDLDSLKSWNFEVKVTDSISSTTVSQTLSRGRPILFIDTVKSSLGFNDFPNDANQFFVNGRIVFGANQWASSANQGETGAGAMYLNNSDITGVNGIWFNDRADNDGEGLLFLKSTATQGSTNSIDYDVFRILDGVAYVSGVPVFQKQQQVLWSGAWYMNGSQSIPLSGTKALSKQPNGWVLVWSDFDPPSTPNNYNFVFHFIPKWFGMMYSGCGACFAVTANQTGSDPPNITSKYLYINDTKIDGNDINQSGYWMDDVVLRYVLGV